MMTKENDRKAEREDDRYEKRKIMRSERKSVVGWRRTKCRV
jgi:hypothetical protein